MPRCRLSLSLPLVLASAGLAAGGLAGAAPAAAAGSLAPSAFDRDITDSQWHLRVVGAPQAWQVSTGAGVTVAVVDTGVDTAHPELAGAVTPEAIVAYGDGVRVVPSSAIYDSIAHGTHVAGLIAARADGRGVTGVAPDASILPVKILSDAPRDSSTHVLGQGPSIDWEKRLAEALRAAKARGASVVNMSFGSAVAGYTDVTEHPLCKAITSVADLDLVLVAASGNDGVGDNRPAVPAQCPGVLSVGATDDAGQPAFFSTFNPRVGISAPGLHVMSTLTGVRGPYGYDSGTSMAAPIVAGVAALVRSAHPDWSAAQVVDRLVATARDVYAVGPDSLTGAGVVDAAAALGVPADGVSGVSLQAKMGEDGVRWRPPARAVSGYVVTLWDHASGAPMRQLQLGPDAVFAPIGPGDGGPGDWVTVAADVTGDRAALDVLFPWGGDTADVASVMPTHLTVVRDERQGGLMRAQWRNAPGAVLTVVQLVRDGTPMWVRSGSAEDGGAMLSAALLPTGREPHTDYAVVVMSIGRAGQVELARKDLPAREPAAWSVRWFDGRASVTADLAPSALEKDADGKRSQVVRVQVSSGGQAVVRELRVVWRKGRAHVTLAALPGARVRLLGVPGSFTVPAAGAAR